MIYGTSRLADANRLAENVPLPHPAFCSIVNDFESQPFHFKFSRNVIVYS
jgi:hypothetical protein